MTRIEIISLKSILMKILLGVLVFILYLYSIEGLNAQPGNLDKSFGNNGIVLTTIGPRDNAIISIAIQQDKKIVGAGYTYNGSNYDFALARYDTIGSLDPDFGTNGIVTTDIGHMNNSAYSLNIQNDGKIVLAGYAGNSSYSDFALARYDTNGSLDSTFGINGVVITQFDESSQILSSVLEDDGKIIAVGREGGSGSPSQNVFALCRYNTDGTLDRTFGIEGKVITAINNVDDVATSVAIRKNKKILIAGWSYEGFNPNFALVQYNYDGSLDQTFGTDGKIVTSFPFSSLAWSLAIQKDDRIILSGASFDSKYYNFTLVRYNAYGSLDTTFGLNGHVVSKIGVGDNFARAVKVQSDGKILVAGYSLDTNLKYDFTLAQYDTTGGLDKTFGINGIVTTSISGFNDWAFSIAIQNNGKIIVGGDAHFNDTISSFAITQYMPGLNMGIINAEVARNSILIYPNPIAERATLTYVLTEVSLVNVSLIDINGKVIKTFIDNQVQEIGTHSQDIFLSAGLASGTYFLIASTNKRCVCIKIIKE